ncbi:MAG: hypothetical protein AAF492_20925 [Verrucomicrobiota bacterium]
MSTSRLMIHSTKAGRYEEIFEDLLEGEKLPFVTSIYVQYGPVFVVAALVLTMVGLILLFQPRFRTVLIPYIVFLNLAAMVLAETAAHAYLLPLENMLWNLSG